jgi:hypothetical protein
MTDRMNRRTFLKTTAATGASLALVPRVSVRAMAPRAADPAKSRVVEAFAPGVMGKGKRPDDPRVRKMLEQGILELTGKEDLAEAWRCFVKPDDVVGLKVNPAGGRALVTHRAILETVIDGVRLAGVPNERIFLWEQVEEYLSRHYFTAERIRPEELGIGITGCTPALRPEHFREGKPLPGFDTEPIEFDWGEVKVAELITSKLTAIINLPVLKDHACSGVTLSLKNISHAVIHTPWFCHANACDPYIADIVNIPTVRDKLRLHILDGLQGLAEGGPNFRTWDHVFTKERLLLSADPVAVDSIGHEWIAAVRKERDYPPLEEAPNRIPGQEGRPATHIATAAARGLGTDDPARIDLRRVEIAADGAKKDTR